MSRLMFAVVNALLSHFVMWTIFWVLLMLELLTDQDRQWWVIAMPLFLLYGVVWTVTLWMLWQTFRGEEHAKASALETDDDSQ